MKLDLRFLVPGPDAATLLVAADGSLPATLVDTSTESEATVVPISELLREVWKLDAAVLETHPKWDEVATGEPIPTLVWTESAPGAWIPPGGLAFGPLPADPGAIHPAIRTRALELLGEMRGAAPPPALRPRWARPGWFERASAWFGVAASEAGRPLTGPPRPFYLRGISALLRAPTGGPDLFLKAVFPPFHAEPAITRLLAARFPSTVPAVVAIEPDEGWLIVEDIGSDWVGDVTQSDRPDALRRGAAAIITMQRELAADHRMLATLLDAGACRRPLGELAQAVAAAIGPDGMGVLDGGLEPARARRVVDAVAAAVVVVEALGLPESVVHGDFHSGNAAVVGDRIVIIDWSDAAIANPAIDLVTWLVWSAGQPAEVDAATGAWIDAWSAVVDPIALRTALDDILIVGAAYQIVSYDGIRRNLEPATRYTMTGGGDLYLTTLEAILDRRAASV